MVGGIDVGSTTTKVVLLNRDRSIAAASVVPTGGAVRNAIEECVDRCLREAGVSRDSVRYWVATGYGRELVWFAQVQITEISCHARGVNMVYPEARTVIDIGGQDTKAISVDGSGRVMSFVMNDKCAAGTGKFVEVIARSLGVGLGDMGQLARQSKLALEVSSMCTVFAESEVISLLAQGHDKSDIIAAVFRALARRIATLVSKIGVVPPVVVSGGGALNVGLVAALEASLQADLVVPRSPQLIGALGAAGVALQRSERHPYVDWSG